MHNSMFRVTFVQVDLSVDSYSENAACSETETFQTAILQDYTTQPCGTQAPKQASDKRY